MTACMLLLCLTWTYHTSANHWTAILSLTGQYHVFFTSPTAQEFQTKGGRLTLPVGCYHLEDWLLDAISVPVLLRLLQTGRASFSSSEASLLIRTATRIPGKCTAVSPSTVKKKICRSATKRIVALQRGR